MDEQSDEEGLPYGWVKPGRLFFLHRNRKENRAVTLISLYFHPLHAKMTKTQRKQYPIKNWSMYMKNPEHQLQKRKRRGGGWWKFLLVLLILPFAVAGYARYIEPYLLITKTIHINVQSEVPESTIVFFTDTHFGQHYGEENLERIVQRINRANPDLVIFGGDFLDNYARDKSSLDLDYIKEELSNIQSRYGKFAVWGNHDYGGGAERVYEELMTGGGFLVLDDESCLIEELNLKLFGYDDILLGSTDPALYEIKSQYFNLITAHEPVVADYIENTGENLFLSGHTHGGQVGIPAIREKVVPKGSGRYVKGLYSQEEIGTQTPMQMYVSSGIGTVIYPLRFLNVPEIVEIRLNQQK